MAKLVDALPSGGSVRKDVQVRILFWAQLKRQIEFKSICLSFFIETSAYSIETVYGELTEF